MAVVSELSTAVGWNTLRLLTFNIWQPPFVRDVRRRAELARELIEDADADVVVLNEAFNRPAHQLVDRLCSAGYHATPQLARSRRRWASTSGRRGPRPGLVGGGVRVLSRCPVLVQHQHVFTARSRTTSDTLSAKGVALVRLATPLGRLWVAATHLQADERGDRHPVRLAQLRELRRAVDGIVGPAEMVVLAGDLNVGSDPVGNADYAEAVRTVGADPQVGSQALDHTYDTATNPLAAASSSGAFRNALDHVWLLRPVAGCTVETRTLRFAPGLEASDHYPVLATLTSPRPAGPTRNAPP